jgi:acetyltransferase EpsM
LAGGVTLESGVLMGVGSVAVPCIGIGAWTTVGAGAAVINSLPPQSVCVGNPARVIRSST